MRFCSAFNSESSFGFALLGPIRGPLGWVWVRALSTFSLVDLRKFIQIPAFSLVPFSSEGFR
ncbi:hypothetical protein PIB30_047553, partial [Stylosanthes scabra]|nr:hypothetical protein [Stylosanthes scabra]